MKILFLGKKDDRRGLQARDFCRRALGETESHFGAWGDKLPEDIGWWKGDLIISYLGRWIVPPALLSRAACGAINFHAGPPEYPGIGCQNFALYDGVHEYGVTCHHMRGKVDTGEIISVKRFAVFDTDDVGSLLERSYDYLLTVFYDVITAFAAGGGGFPVSKEAWSRKPFTREELDNLSAIPLNASKEEIARRRRALTFGEFIPFVELNGIRFYPKA